MIKYTSFTSIILMLLLQNNLFCMDLAKTTEELKKAAFAKDYDCVQSILENTKDDKTVQKMGLQLHIPLEYTGIFCGDGMRRDIKIPLYNEKDVLVKLLKKYNGSVTSENYKKAKSSKDLREGRWSVDCTDITYPPSLLGHACFFGNAKMLKTLLSRCDNFDTLALYLPGMVGIPLDLAAEYDSPECFKILYTTPWLNEHFRKNPELLKAQCNYLEAFIFYRQDTKIVETLLKTGCFDINDSIRLYREYPKKFKDKTLLEVVQEKKESSKDKTKAYYEAIEVLLRQYGGKTALEVAAIHPFNDYLVPDVRKNILYRLCCLDSFTQQELRLVCSQWKEIIDSDKETLRSNKIDKMEID